MDLVVEVYNLTEKFPAEEKFVLTSQMRRAAVSIPSNIAEGHRRRHKKEFKQHLSIANGSAAELETQIEIAKRLPKNNKLNFSKTDHLLEEVLKILNVFIRKLS